MLKVSAKVIRVYRRSYIADVLFQLALVFPDFSFGSVFYSNRLILVENGSFKKYSQPKK